MSKIKLVSLLLACFAIIAASPLAMGVTIYGGTGTSVSGGGVADGTTGMYLTQTATNVAPTRPAILDAYVYAHAGVPATATGAASAYAHYSGSITGTFEPFTEDNVNPAPLGTSWTVSAAGDVNAGVSLTAAPAGQVNTYAVLGSRLMKQVSAAGLRTNDPIQGSAYSFSKIDGSAVTTSILPLGGTGATATLPELGTPVAGSGTSNPFDPVAMTPVVSGEAYARAQGAAAFSGIGRGTLANGQTSQIYGNVNANTYVGSDLTDASVDAMSAAVASASARPAAVGQFAGDRLVGDALIASYAKAGIVTRLDIAQGLGGRSSATATVAPASDTTPAARSGAWDYTIGTTGRLPTVNENAYAESTGSLSSSANTRIAGDVAGTGARMNVIAAHDMRVVPRYGANQYAATFIQTYGAAQRVGAPSASSQVMAYGSQLQNAGSASIVREGTKTTSQSTDIGAIPATLDEGFLAGGHILNADPANVQYASSLFTQEAFGGVDANDPTVAFQSSDAVLINRGVGGLPAPTATLVQVNDPYGFWRGTGLTAAVLPATVAQGLENLGPAWTGVRTNDVGSIYGLSSTATANFYGDNVRTDAGMSDINWVEGSSLIWTIQNLARSFTYSPVGGSNADIVVTQAANPPAVPYWQRVGSTNFNP